MKLVDNWTYDTLEDAASGDEDVDFNYIAPHRCCFHQKLKDTNNALKVGWQSCALFMVYFIVNF